MYLIDSRLVMYQTSAGENFNLRVLAGNSLRLFLCAPTLPLTPSQPFFWMSLNGFQNLFGERCVTSKKRLGGKLTLPRNYP